MSPTLGLGLALGDTDAEELLEGESEADGETDGLTELLGLTLADGDTDGLTLDEGDCEALGLTDGLSLLEGETDAEGLTDGETLEDGDTDADGDTDGLTLGETLLDGLTLALDELLGDRLALGLTDALGDTDGLTELEGDTLAEGETLGLTEDDGLRDADGETEALELDDGDSDADGLTEAEGETDGLTLELPAPAASMSSSATQFQSAAPVPAASKLIVTTVPDVVVLEALYARKPEYLPAMSKGSSSSALAGLPSAFQSPATPRTRLPFADVVRTFGVILFVVDEFSPTFPVGVEVLHPVHTSTQARPALPVVNDAILGTLTVTVSPERAPPVITAVKIATTPAVPSASPRSTRFVHVSAAPLFVTAGVGVVPPAVSHAIETVRTQLSGASKLADVPTGSSVAGALTR